MRVYVEMIVDVQGWKNESDIDKELLAEMLKEDIGGKGKDVRLVKIISVA